MDSYRDLIDQWPSVKTLASDLAVKPNTASKWRQRDKIPPEHWLGLVKAARKRQIRVDESQLVRLAHRTAS
jgi:DNA-binding transcriptional regulator YhcF (GntR family)